MDQPRFSKLFVVGVGHSGSTLLGRMLNMHPDIICVGELLRLDHAVDNPDEHCFCDTPLNMCSFWSRWAPKFPESVKRDYLQWTPELIDYIRTEEGKKVIVDLSKTRSYRLTKDWKDTDICYLFIVRDPRGVMRSALHKGGDLSDLLPRHKKWIERYESFAKKRRSTCLTVFYEELACSPETHLQRVCYFLGLRIFPAMFTPDSKTHHFVHSSGSRYLKSINKLRVDDRWRTELTLEQIERINKYLGKVDMYRHRYQLLAPVYKL